jgi:ribosomal protein L7/L12
MDLALLGLLVTSSIAFVLLWIAGRREKAAAREQPSESVEDFLRRPSQANEAAVPIPVGDAVSSSPSNFEFEVRMLIDYGNKAGAIRVVREKMGLDLKDATDIVEAMERGAPIPIQTTAPAASGGDTLHDEARELIVAGKVIEAITLVRERKGLDLKQAKAYVERL